MKIKIDKEDWEYGLLQKHEWENPVRSGSFEGYEATGMHGAQYYVCPTNKYWTNREGIVYELRNKEWKKISEIDESDIELVD